MQSISKLLNQRQNFTPRIKLHEIATESGIAVSTLSQIATGHVQNPRYSTAICIINALKKLSKGRRRKRATKSSRQEETPIVQPTT